MKKFVFFVIASALLAGCSECNIVAPSSEVLPPPEPTKGYSSGRVRAFSIAESDTSEKKEKAPADSIQMNLSKD